MEAETDAAELHMLLHSLVCDSHRSGVLTDQKPLLLDEVD